MDEPRVDSAASDSSATGSGSTLAAGLPRKQHWRQLLAGSSPREVLARILNGDPLDLQSHVVERLHARAYLLDADRVHLRSLARCARFAARYRGQPDLSDWLREIVDQALLDLLREDAEAERSSAAESPEELAAYVELARPLGLEPTAMRAVCVAYNQLPEPDRRAFYELLIEGRSLDELARAWKESATEIARRARRALEAVLLPASSAPESKHPEAGASKASDSKIPTPKDGKAGPR